MLGAWGSVSIRIPIATPHFLDPLNNGIGNVWESLIASHPPSQIRGREKTSDRGHWEGPQMAIRVLFAIWAMALAERGKVVLLIPSPPPLHTIALMGSPMLQE